MNRDGMSNESLYQVLDTFLVRSPTLPFDTPSYCEVPELFQKLAFTAIEVGSRSLSAALRSDARSQHVGAKMRKYLKRMSTRPTPYGLFAGVGIGVFRQSSDLQRTQWVETHLRPDMSWLIEIIEELETSKTHSRKLAFFTNQLAIRKAGRVWLDLCDGSNIQTNNSLRATAPVLHVLELCTTRSYRFDELSENLCSEFKVEKPVAEAVCDCLIANKFLLSSLRFAQDNPDPLAYVINELIETQSDLPVVGVLLDVQHTLQTSLDLDDVSYRALISNIPEPAATVDRLQIDTRFDTDGDGLTKDVGLAASEAAELLRKRNIWNWLAI